MGAAPTAFPHEPQNCAPGVRAVPHRSQNMECPSSTKPYAKLAAKVPAPLGMNPALFLTFPRQQSRTSRARAERLAAPLLRPQPPLSVCASRVVLSPPSEPCDRRTRPLGYTAKIIFKNAA